MSGMKKNEFDLHLLNAARVVHRGDWNWKNVSSPFARVYMVEQGQAKVIMHDGDFTITPNHLYLIPPHVIHSYENDETFTLYYFHIYNEYDIFSCFNFSFEVDVGELEVMMVKRLLEINPGRNLKYSNPKIYDNFNNLLDTISENNKNAFSQDVETDSILKILLLRFLSSASVKHRVNDSRISKAVRYIRENVEKNIYVKDLAEICFLDKDYFTRLFKKEMGCTPMQYLMQKKIEKAQISLLTGRTNIKNIAYDLSFNSISHFCTSFKKITGVSPSDFINKHYRNKDK